MPLASYYHICVTTMTVLANITSPLEQCFQTHTLWLYWRNMWTIKQCPQSCSEPGPGREIRKIIFPLLSLPKVKGSNPKHSKKFPHLLLPRSVGVSCSKVHSWRGRKQTNRGNELKQSWKRKHMNRHCFEKFISWHLAWFLPYLSNILTRLRKHLSV